MAGNAIPAAGAFPVVLYSLGTDTRSLENVVLWEYLASHGYVVVATPSVGHGPVEMETIGPTAVEVRARDLEFALRFIRDLPYADQRRVATVGSSLGGCGGCGAAFVRVYALIPRSLTADDVGPACWLPRLRRVRDAFLRAPAVRPWADGQR